VRYPCTWGLGGRSVLIAASARSGVPTFEYPVMPHRAYLDPERRRHRDGANTESSSTKRLGKPSGTTKFRGGSPERQERDVRPSCSIPLDDRLSAQRLARPDVAVGARSKRTRQISAACTPKPDGLVMSYHRESGNPRGSEGRRQSQGSCRGHLGVHDCEH
jgi:hypothetical protein